MTSISSATSLCVHGLAGSSVRPEPVRMVIASRSSDPFPLSSFRLQGGLVEVDGEMLALSHTESQQLLWGLGITASSDEIVELTDHTEGWVAGLQLAALALAGEGSAGRLLSGFDGADRLVVEYLTTEVIDRLDPVDRQFLLLTSILEWLNGDLCDAVSGLGGSAVRLERLERDNAFVLSLDREQTWFRYHHLFSEMLSSVLKRHHPDLVADLHRRAGAWLRANGLPLDAVEHLLAAGERGEAGELVSAEWYHLVNAGRIETLGRLLAQFDHDEIVAHRPLALAAAWLSGLSGDDEVAGALLDAVARSDDCRRPPDGSSSFTSALAMARSVFGWEGVAQALADARLAHSLEPPGSPWRPVAAWLVADRLIWNDEWDSALPYLHEVIAAPADHRTIRALAWSMLAKWHLERGEIDDARSASDRGYAIVEETAIGDLVTAPSVYSIRCRVAVAAGDVGTATASFDAMRDPVSRVDRALPLGGIHARLLAAEAALAMGDVQEADAHVSKAAIVDAQIPDTGGLGAHLVRLRDQIDEIVLMAKKESLSSSELAVLDWLPTELSIREIAGQLFLSPNTVKTHVKHIYEKLDAHTRDQAVDRARQIGLVPSLQQAQPPERQ